MKELAIAHAVPELPDDEIVIAKNGQVKSISEWALWNLEPWETLKVGRQPNGSFYGAVSSPSSLAVSETTLEEVLCNMPGGIQKKYQRLFKSTHLTDDEIYALGFGPKRLKITRL